MLLPGPLFVTVCHVQLAKVHKIIIQHNTQSLKVYIIEENGNSNKRTSQNDRIDNSKRRKTKEVVSSRVIASLDNPCWMSAFRLVMSTRNYMSFVLFLQKKEKKLLYII